MICPYCKSEMYEGVVYGDRYRLKWIPKDKDKGPFLQCFSKGGIVLEETLAGVVMYYCEKDGVFLIKREKVDESNNESVKL